MSDDPRTLLNTGKILPKHSGSNQTDGSGNFQPEDEETHPLTDREPGKVQRIKEPAEDLLVTLTKKRVTTTEIIFTEYSPRDGGAYADVAVATFIRRNDGSRRGKKVAVKKLRFVQSNDMTHERFLRAFVNEALILDSLSHLNIVELIGFVEDMEHRIAWLIFPWEDNGNLREFLRSGTWEIPERVSLILDVTAGLEYLHNHKPPICHGDLKSLNILVNSSNRAVITDLGSARVLREAQEAGAGTTLEEEPSRGSAPLESTERSGFNITVFDTALTLTGPACSFRWAPPEYFDGKSLDRASDIWALGWIAWEATTDCHPFHEIEGEGNITMKIMEGQLPSIYDHQQLSQIHRLCGIMQNCWNVDPKKRPSAVACWKALKWLPHTIPTRRSGDQSKVRSAELLMKLGETHRLQGRYEEASRMFERGLDSARSTGDENVEAEILNRLGATYRAQFNYAKAKACYAEALAIFSSIGENRGRANTLNELGNLYRERHKYLEAEAYYSQALAIFTSIRDDICQANAFEGFRDVRKRTAETEAPHVNALTNPTSTGIDLGQANALYGLGEIRRDCSRYLEAEELYTQALGIYQRIGGALGKANSSIELAKLRIHQARHAEASTLLKEAVTISIQMQYGWGSKTSQTLLNMVPSSDESFTGPPPFTPG